MPPFVNSVVAMARRDSTFYYDDTDSFWWSTTGQIVRWAVFGGIFLLLITYGIFGYWHAKRRLARGLPPLAYHRFLLGRRRRSQFDPRYQDPALGGFYYSPDQYGMHAYPPPVYDPNSAPPQYQPPEGASKVNPSQGRAEASSAPVAAGEPSPEYAPPSSPPPSAIYPDQTGSSNTSNNPFRQ